jgi:hypothetical protein
LGVARGKTYSVSSTQWLDVEECKDLVTLEEFEGWDVTCFIEDQSHPKYFMLGLYSNSFGK